MCIRDSIMDERIAVQHLHPSRITGCRVSVAVQHITHGQAKHGAHTLSAAEQAVPVSYTHLSQVLVPVAAFMDYSIAKIRAAVKPLPSEAFPGHSPAPVP